MINQRMAASISARTISSASMSPPTIASSPHAVHSFVQIGRDALSLITSFLTHAELILVSQVNRLFSDNLQRRQSYYHPPFPSFTRMGFNMNHYREWRETRQPLLMTPTELIRFSYSRVMTHHSDIELHIGQCFGDSSIPLPNSSTASHTKSKRRSTLTVTEQLNEIRAAVSRFQDVRALRLVFAPTSSEFISACSCTKEWAATNNWMISMGEICFKEWSHNLISFELDIHPHYPCRRALTERFLLPHFHQLTSIQHLGLYLSNHHYLLDGLWESFKFPSPDTGLIIFLGGSTYQFFLTPEARRQSAQTFAKIKAAAAHCIWLPGALSDPHTEDVLEYLDETNQLLTNEATGAYQSRTQPNTNLPLVPFRREQIRTLRIYERNERPGGSLEKQLADMKQQLEFLVANFVQSEGQDERHLEWLTVWDEFYSHRYEVESISDPIDYRHYLRHLRSTLRILHFRSSIDTWSYVGGPSGAPTQPPLPIHLAYNDRQIEKYVWSQLESLEVRFMHWEAVWNQVEYPPLFPPTWAALERTLPKLESLGLSIGLVPSPIGDQPCLTGILTRIKHLHLFSYHVHPLLRMGDSRPSRAFDPNFMATRLTMICIQLRQLESLHLNLRDQQKEIELDVDDQRYQFYETILIPLLASSNNLRHVHLVYFRMDEPNLELFEEIHQTRLYLFYVVWKLLQPSFEPPLNYTTVQTFVGPFLSPDIRGRYDPNMTRLQTLSDPNLPRGDDGWNDRLKKRFQSWKRGVREWAGGKALRHEREMKQRQVVEARQKQFQQIYTQLQQKLVTFFDQHKLGVVQPRVFTLTLDTPGSRHEEYDQRL